MSTRIGPQMSYLAARVVDGESICSLVDRCYRTRRGYKSRWSGYAAVHRAISAGIIKAKVVRKGRGGVGLYALYRPSEG